MAKIIDLSVSVSIKGNLTRMPEITYIDHAQSARNLAQTYGIDPKELREGKYAAVERVCLGTHETTHLDSPYHFYPTSEGKPSKTIDQIPLEWCYGDGVVLDFHHKEKGERITAQEVKDSLNSIGYKLKPFDILLIRTDRCKHYLEPGYENMHPGMTAEATLWLINQGLKVMGTDAWGWDRAHDVMIRDLKAGDKEQFWESHYLGKEHEYCHVERMANLDQIPKPFGFKVAVFPIKIENASAGWVRAVAIFEE